MSVSCLGKGLFESPKISFAARAMLSIVPALGPKGPRKVDGIKLPKYENKH